jgi:hypothetical protein
MMKRVALLFMVIEGILLSSLVACAPAKEKEKIQWETVSEPGFSISMPGKPIKSEENSIASGFEISAHTLTVDVDREEYSLTYSDCPHTQRMDSIEPAQIFDLTQNKLLAMKTGRKLVSEKDLTLNSNPGREVIFEDPSEGAVNTVRLYWVKPRLYTLVFARLKARAPSANSQKFLDSFKILSQ